MKHILLSVAAVCLLAGQASAGLYTLDYSTALTFNKLAGSGLLNGVYDGLATPPNQWEYQNPWLPAQAYPSPMLGDVGFVGSLSGNQSWMRIGATGTFGTGTTSSFGAWLGNDDQSAWEVRLVANNTPESTWTSISPGQFLWFDMPVSGPLTMIGFEVRLNTGLTPTPSPSDSFNISAVPIPAAVLLGMLGLGVAGMKLRKFV